jgi:hypothetical protein
LFFNQLTVLKYNIQGKKSPLKKTQKLSVNLSQLIMCFASKNVKRAVRSVLFMCSSSVLLIKYKAKTLLTVQQLRLCTKTLCFIRDKHGNK